MREDKNEQERKKLQYLLYGMLWFLLMIFVSAYAYQEHKFGDASFFTAADAVGRFGIFYWLNPVTWGACIKWSFVILDWNCNVFDI